MTNRRRQTVLFEDAFIKPVQVVFDADSLSSDGGTTLLAQLDRGIGLTHTLIGTLLDTRQRSKVDFTYTELLRQRTYAIALGYEDASDASTLGRDPVMKLAVGREPSDDDLASQSTISRFENSHTAREIVAMGRALETFVIGRLAKRHRKAKVVTIDFDSTVDPVHGGQQLALFSGFHGTHCYLPLLGFMSIDDDPDQHLFHARLRPGTVRCYRGLIPTLKRTVPEVRRRFPKARIHVRFDAGFYHPRVLEVLESLNVSYAMGMAKDTALEALSKDLMDTCRTIAEKRGESTKLFGSALHRAKSWRRERRIVFKAEVVHYPGKSLRDNARYVITNRTTMKPENVYAWYCGRGDSENRIKELKVDLAIDRTSCRRFLANQFRVVMTAAAFVLFQELRWRLRRSRAAHSSVAKLREMLLKIATRVVTSCRRIVCHFPTHMPWADVWQVAARSTGAIAT